MPPLIAALPAIAAIASIGSAGTAIGLDIANSGGGGSKATPPPVATTAQQQQTQQAETAAVGQAAPTIEGLTSGYANPGYYAQQGSLQAGTAGEPNDQNASARAIEQAFGLPPGSIGGGGGGPSSSTKPFTPAGVGNPSQGAFPTGTTDLSSFVNTFFKG